MLGTFKHRLQTVITMVTAVTMSMVVTVTTMTMLVTVWGNTAVYYNTLIFLKILYGQLG